MEANPKAHVFTLMQYSFCSVGEEFLRTVHLDVSSLHEGM